MIFVPITGETLYRHAQSHEVLPLKRWLACAAPLGAIGARASIEGFIANGLLVREAEAARVLPSVAAHTDAA
jgi:hypothetical protein